MTVCEPKIQRLPIDQIDACREQRLRPVTEAGVCSLIASIEDLGVIKDAIHVRRKRRAGGESLVLMAGAHRLEAATRLGWETIPARVWADVTDDFARLMEIDDNLAGADLSALELSVFLAERKRVYERLHPETKAGVAGALAKHGSANDIMSFADSVAEKREFSKRHIERFIWLGNALSSDEVAALAASEQPLKLKDLMALAKLSEPSDRRYVIGQIAADHATSVGDAIAKLKPETPKPNPDDQAYERLIAAWKRAPMKVKRRFLEEREPEITDMLSGKPGLKVV